MGNLVPDAIRHARLPTFAVLALAVAGAGVAVALEAPAPAAFVVRIASPVAEPAPPGMFLSVLRPAAAAPLPTGPADAAARARLEKYYTVLTEELRAVPGLVLVTVSTADPTGLEEAAIKLGVPTATAGLPAVGYEIAMRLCADWQGVAIEAMALRQPGPKVLWRTTSCPDSFLGTAPLTVLWDPPPPENPQREMEFFVETIRLTLFPRDRALLDKKLSELRDPQLEPNLRRVALARLLSADSRRASLGSDRIPQTYRPDPALISAATDVAMTESDAAMRDQVWKTLRSATIPRMDPAVLVVPAQQALVIEEDPRVQLELVNILGMSAANPRARAALESVAGSDRLELVRMAARRVLNGGAGWNEYFVARLNDPQVPDADRLELIRYMRSSVSTLSGLGALTMQLDEAVERSLGGQLKKPASTQVVSAAAELLGWAGGAAAREELIDFLRTGLGQPLADAKIRRSVLSQMAFGRSLRPEIRQLFEEISARDSDSLLRAAARQALDEKD